TMPVSSCSLPIGRWTATQRSDSCSRSWPSVRWKSARSRSSMFTKSTRESPSSSARCHIRPVCTSTPITPLTVKSAPSTTRSAAIASPTKPASPGASIRLIFSPCHSRWQTDAASDIWRRCSSSSQSDTVEPASTVPSRFVAPAWKSIASTSEVFPVPRWPTAATLRICDGSTAAMRAFPPYEGGWPAGLIRRSCLGGRADGSPREPCLQAQNRLGVQLRNARLGDAEDLADLAQRQLLIVVERDDELLALGQPREKLEIGRAHV